MTIWQQSNKIYAIYANDDKLENWILWETATGL